MGEEAEPTQTTDQDAEIPVPTRDDVFDAFRKVAKAPSADKGEMPEER